jgi:hypothetical protein
MPKGEDGKETHTWAACHNPAMFRPEMLRRRLATLLAAGLLAGCGSPASPTPAPTTSTTASPTFSPAAAATPIGPVVTPPGATATPLASGDAARLYRQIEDQVAALRELPIRQRIEPRLLDEAQLATELRRMFDAESTPDDMAITERTLKALGLLDPGASLRDLELALMGGQVAGFYENKAKTLSVVARGGTVGPLERATFAHEFDHALQDQAYDLQVVLPKATGQGDRALARLAVVEGDASLLEAQWMYAQLTSAEMAEIVREAQAAQPQFDAAPAFLRTSLMFPYENGLGFVMGRWSNGGWASVDALYADLPVSTEQVLHAAKYAAGEQPVTVDLDGAALARALGTGWTATPADTFGELQLRAWLSARLPSGETGPSATDAAAGWGGDRTALLNGPAGAYALAIVTAWDSPTDAEEFAAAARVAISGVPGAAAVVQVPAPSSVAPRWAVLAASDADALARLREAIAPAP